MSFFTPNTKAMRLWIALLGVTPLWQFLHDLWGSYVDTFQQHAMIRPWYSIFPLLYIKLIAVAAYGYGRNRDSRFVNADTVVVFGKKQSYVVQLDRDKEARELRMGILGQPNPDRATFPDSPSDPLPSPRTAVICPVYLSDLVVDLAALEGLYKCLHSQDRRPDLIVFVDDHSPLLNHTSYDRKPNEESDQLNNGKHNTLEPVNGHTAAQDPYHLLDLESSNVPTVVLRLPSNLGPAGARNAGIDCAIAELGRDPGNTVLFLTDLDCLPPSDWIRNGYQAVLARRPTIETPDNSASEPLVIGGITCSADCGSSIYTYYHDFYGTLNPRVWISPSTSADKVHPLYAPSCNLIIYPGHPASRKQLPRFHEGFREPSMEDVLFCLELVFRRGCELALDRNVKMRHVHREGFKGTWSTFRKYGRWEPAVNLLFPSYAQGLLRPSKSISSLA